MSLEDYKKAQKMAIREYHSRVANGKYPYLPALMDDILPQGEALRKVNLGLVDIPLDRIVGTYTAGRQNAFAANFMPLLDANTEFSVKWISLCEAHVSEGIHDSIIAYEYMNYFYVQEGNKRVSVLKYFESDSFPGTVVRIMPAKSDDVKVRIYYEFVDFYEHSQVNYIEFSQPGRYAKLLDLLGMKPDHDWTDIDKETFYSVYHRFKGAFLARGGGKLPMTVADALLSYIEVMGYDDVKNKLPGEIREDLGLIWSEFVIMNQETPVEHQLEPKAPSSASIITKIITPLPKVLKVAFIHDKSPLTSAWTYQHELGRAHIATTFKEKIETSTYNDALSGGNPTDVIERAIEDGNKVIFTTTPQLGAASLKAAAAHPDVSIYNCSLNYSHSLIKTYYARLYEAKFLTGVIAGALADHNEIGYVADYPIFGTTADVNAFAIGASMSNPRAKIKLKWSALAGSDPVNEFRREKVGVVMGQNLVRRDNIRKEYGLFTLDNSGVTNVALSLFDWGKFYERIIDGVFKSGTIKEDTSDAKKSLNYWWGLDAGVVDCVCSLKLSLGTRKLLDLLRQNITSGVFSPFEGEIIAQNGVVINREGRLTPEQMVSMDWLCENVEGEIPAIEDLRPDARPVVWLQGIAPAEKTSLGENK
ncbi:MAG: BMP family ABC transporter substrate-binding protein [Lachnospiraceae bacterium]|nr:BMP family ABC transporter substrate-binding protein [Lachnospiraceae bacterium]